MIKKVINWWLSVVKAGKARRARVYQWEGGPAPAYVPTVEQKLKATLLIFITFAVAFLLFIAAIVATQGLVLVLLPLAAGVAMIYGILGRDY